MSSATADCERCRAGDLNNHWDHRTKETFQTIYDRVKFLLDNKPREWKKELQGAMRELLAKHIERAIGRQIVKTKVLFDGSNLFPQKDDPDAPNYFRWGFNGNYQNFPEKKMSSWTELHILELFEALESDELYIEDLEKAPDLSAPKFQLVRAVEDAFKNHILEHTDRPVKDLQKCLVGDGSAGLRGWKWDFPWREEFHKFPHQRLLWKWSDKDLKASMGLLKNGSLKLVPRIESLRSSSSSVSCEKTIKKEPKPTKAARRRRNTTIPNPDDKGDKENEPHNDGGADDFDSGSTVVVDDGSNSSDFDSFLPMTFKLLEYPARHEKLKLEMSELQNLYNTLRKSNIDLGIEAEDAKKEIKSASRFNKMLVHDLEEKELEAQIMNTKCDRLERENEELSKKYAASQQKLEVREMKAKCDHLERENEELRRKYAASEQKREKVERDAEIVINRVMAISEGCYAVTADLEQDKKDNRALVMGLLASMNRSLSPVRETITRPIEPPGQAGHQESPRKTHTWPSNIPTSKISQNPHLGVNARARLVQSSLNQQSPTRLTRPALMDKPNNANVSTFNGHHASNIGRGATGISAKNTKTAQGSENIAQEDTEWWQTEPPDCETIRSRLADDQSGPVFPFKRGSSDDDGPPNTSKKARN